jgi:hypothetical protein
MNDDRSTVTIPDHGFAVIVDAVQRTVLDKGASKATRKAAFSAILALVDAGLIIGVTPPSAPAKDVRAPTPVSTRLRLMG